MIDFFKSWYFQNVLVAVLVLFMAWMVWGMRRSEFWCAAFRRVLRRKLAKISFIILSIYCLIALLDSVGFNQPLRDVSGKVQLSAETGRVMRDARGMSILDFVLTPLRKSKEKTYSAPLASHQFTKETIMDDLGNSVRAYPVLKYPHRHLFGTDKVGNDVLYIAVKGIRTGIIIGGVTTLLVVPFAILFGVVGGYFGGWLDDLIQYIYTVLSSIPSVLLIVAFMIVFEQGLTQLCIIMGITSWTGLCRVLRGETMKLREMEYIQACEAMGISKFRIMFSHITPNIMHIVLITAVLGFSGRVLSEAVLSYIGIGVGADTVSWGSMINDARMEMARSPVIWWKLFAAFIFMLGLVLPANMFGDALRDALDPRLRSE